VNVLVRHIKAGEGGDEEADGYDEKEDLQGQRVVRLGRCRGSRVG